MMLDCLRYGQKLFYHKECCLGVSMTKCEPNTIAPSLESLKLALGRLERATSRVEIATRKGAAASSDDAMTSGTLKALETGLESAIGRIDSLLKDTSNGRT
jgi:hypothetical protein